MQHLVILSTSAFTRCSNILRSWSLSNVDFCNVLLIVCWNTLYHHRLSTSLSFPSERVILKQSLFHSSPRNTFLIPLRYFLLLLFLFVYTFPHFVFGLSDGYCSVFHFCCSQGICYHLCKIMINSWDEFDRWANIEMNFREQSVKMWTEFKWFRRRSIVFYIWS